MSRPSWLARALAFLPLGRAMRNERRSERLKIGREVVLVRSGGHEVTVKLKELSREGGFRVEHEGEDLHVGEIVEIRTRHESGRAQILWVKGEEAGGTFTGD